MTACLHFRLAHLEHVCKSVCASSMAAQPLYNVPSLTDYQHYYGHIYVKALLPVRPFAVIVLEVLLLEVLLTGNVTLFH